MTCKACIREALEGNLFCRHCGNRLPSRDPEPYAATPAAPNPPDSDGVLDTDRTVFSPYWDNLPLVGSPRPVQPRPPRERLKGGTPPGRLTQGPKIVEPADGTSTGEVQCPNCGGTDVATLATWAVDFRSGVEVELAPPSIDESDEPYLRNRGLHRALTWFLFLAGVLLFFPGVMDLANTATAPNPSGGLLIFSVVFLIAWLIHLVLRGVWKSEADERIAQARRQAESEGRRRLNAYPKRHASRCELCGYSWKWGHGLPKKQVHHRPDLIDAGQKKKMVRLLEAQTEQLQIQGRQLRAQEAELERQRSLMLLGILALWDKRGPSR